MLYGRHQLLLLSQSDFKQLLSANLWQVNIISTYATLLAFVDKKKTMESVHYERRRLLVVVLNTYFSKVSMINFSNT